MPQPSELLSVDGFCRDPLGELAADSDWLCKYPNRSLILTSNHCVVNCRFCFRRHFFTNKSNNVPINKSPFERLNEQNKFQRDTIEELILSGGDPLTLTDSELSAFIDNAVKHLPNLQRLRIHSRVPVVIPKRLTESLAEILCDKRVVCYLVLHINHPREADNEFAERIERFTKSGIPIMSQTVLLKNVNDNATTLIQLFKRLVNLRVVPYYLHQLDRVAGAAHFEVNIEHGRELMNELRKNLPGYAVPRYVQELPDAPAKVPL
jgi:EF-P beta-lysylation protein EpmB